MTLTALMRPLQAHKKFGIPRDRLYKAIHNGELKTINLGTEKKASFLIRQSDLEAWLEHLTHGGTK